MGTPIENWPSEQLARDREIPEPGEGHGWIQWKGTNVCMDVQCRCGAHGHIDDDFVYFYKCLACGTTFAVGQTVRLYALTPKAAEEHGERAKVDEAYCTSTRYVRGVPGTVCDCVQCGGDRGR